MVMCASGIASLTEWQDLTRVLLKILHSLLVDITGFNIMTPISAAVHTVTNVPRPLKVSAMAKTAAADSSSTSANSKKKN
jgi:hypothetical protein